MRVLALSEGDKHQQQQPPLPPNLGIYTKRTEVSKIVLSPLVFIYLKVEVNLVINERVGQGDHQPCVRGSWLVRAGIQMP